MTRRPARRLPKGKSPVQSSNTRRSSAGGAGGGAGVKPEGEAPGVASSSVASVSARSTGSSLKPSGSATCCVP